jgi:hypothetical protein
LPNSFVALLIIRLIPECRLSIHPGFVFSDCLG